jgi:periodic tryptophan protein 1
MQEDVDVSGYSSELLGELKENSHSDAVMSLSWNPSVPGRLASGSADTTIKLWDLSTLQCAQTLTHHTGKVQSVLWHPAEQHVLLSGAFDRRCMMVDVRAPDASAAAVFGIDSDLESMVWNPHNPALFLASSESGMVVCYDVRMAAAATASAKVKPLFSIAAHSQPTTSLSFSSRVPHLCCTSSVDGTVKLWDVADAKPSMVASRDMKIGPVFCCSFDVSPTQPLLLSAGGAKGTLGVWDTSENKDVSRRYASFCK